jgi:hexosaminidase
MSIDTSGTYTAYLSDSSGKQISSVIKQQFLVHLGTGKKITLKTQPHQNYSRGGATTLVDGILNNKGMQKSSLFLGFWGTDLEATIDLEKRTPIQKIQLHSFEQAASWIYPPASVSFLVSDDGMNFEKIESNIETTGKRHLVYEIKTSIQARYVKVVALNFGLIPDAQPGGGNQAWLFADEITID